MITKLIVGVLMGLLDNIRQSLSDQKIGAHKQKEKQDVAVRNEQEKWAEIDVTSDSPADAANRLSDFGNKRRNGGSNP